VKRVLEGIEEAYPPTKGVRRGIYREVYTRVYLRVYGRLESLVYLRVYGRLESLVYHRVCNSGVYAGCTQGVTGVYMQGVHQGVPLGCVGGHIYQGVPLGCVQGCIPGCISQVYKGCIPGCTSQGVTGYTYQGVPLSV